jgi:hypothetical protein
MRGNYVWILIRTKGKPFGLHMRLAKLSINTWVGKTDMIMSMEIPFDLKGKFDFHLQNPNISSPSKWVTLVIKVAIGVYF